MGDSIVDVLDTKLREWKEKWGMSKSVIPLCSGCLKELHYEAGFKSENYYSKPILTDSNLPCFICNTGGKRYKITFEEVIE